MSDLRIETITMPAANLGKPCPFTTMKPERTIAWPMNCDESIIPEDRQYINYGCQTYTLPYSIQDNYDRSRQPRDFKVAVLENDILKATFLMEFGGRLWSLYNKKHNVELLYKNPVFQPANLAFRNAWFSGGVEWNMGMPAHNPFTCEKPFFAKLKDNKGIPILRMYEWERVRCCPYQVDFTLPDDSHALFVKVRLTNPNQETTPCYWFSNIAVKETPQTRVIAPADFAYTFDYNKNQHFIKKIDIPNSNGLDLSYPCNCSKASDFYYRIDTPNQIPWIASIDETGKGLFHTSTNKMIGRKLFVWGMGPGGRNWQDFLTEPGNPYIEIQAGIGRTQAECLPLAPGQEIKWVEAYGLVNTDPKITHSPNWRDATTETQNSFSQVLTQQQLKEQLLDFETSCNFEPEEVLQLGSGWGAIENKRRASINTKPISSKALIFSEDSIGKEEQIWTQLLDESTMKEFSPNNAPGGYMAQSKWLDLLEKSTLSDKGNHWLTWLHIGVINFVQNDHTKAIEAWQKSAKLTPNIYALRNIGFLLNEQNKKESALDYYKKAWEIGKTTAKLCVEYGNILLELEKFENLWALLAQADESIRKHPRIQLLIALCYYNKGDYEDSEKVLLSIELADLRENETTLTDLWFDIQAQKICSSKGITFSSELQDKIRKELTPPAKIDYRMNTL